jgi:hypothetical protein
MMDLETEPTPRAAVAPRLGAFPPRQPSSERPTLDSEALTRALRIAGAFLVVASASTFMLQHWQGGNDLRRYAMLVSQSLLLAAAAYFVGLTVREGRSARTFLGLLLATVPVSFAVLGGLVYSQFHLEPLAILPHYASWVAPSKLSALVALAGTLVVLVPLSGLSFVALARREAKALTVAFVAANLLMLVPVREPGWVVLLAGVGFVTLLQLEGARFSRASRLDTFEGRLARAMPFVAPVIMLGRVVHLYTVRPPFVGGVMLIAAASIWLPLARTRSASWRDMGSWAAGLLALCGWGGVWSGFRSGLVSPSWSLISFGVPAALLLVVASRRGAHARGVLAACGVLFGLLTTVAASALDLDGIAAFACIVVGIAVAVWGAALRLRVHLVGGALVALFGLGAQIWLAVQAGHLVRWAGLSVVGILLIVGSAYLERNRATLTEWFERLAARPLEELDE